MNSQVQKSEFEFSLINIVISVKIRADQANTHISILRADPKWLLRWPQHFEHSTICEMVSVFGVGERPAPAVPVLMARKWKIRCRHKHLLLLWKNSITDESGQRTEDNSPLGTNGLGL